MLGWTVLVSTAQDCEINARPIASWTEGPFGTKWLDSLVAEGKAEVNYSNGYPNAYRVKAKHVLPILMSGEFPDSKEPDVISDDENLFERWEVTLNKVAIGTLNEDDLLVIEAWDRS